MNKELKKIYAPEYYSTLTLDISINSIALSVACPVSFHTCIPAPAMAPLKSDVFAYSALRCRLVVCYCLLFALFALDKCSALLTYPRQALLDIGNSYNPQDFTLPPELQVIVRAGNLLKIAEFVGGVRVSHLPLNQFAVTVVGVFGFLYCSICLHFNIYCILPD